MFLLAVFFSGLILAMENGILPGAAEIEYWKWTGVVLCLASALLSRRKDKPGDPLPIFILTSCALADLFLLFTTQWEIGIAVFCLVQLCLSFILISREQTIQLCLITGGLVFIAGLLLKLPKLICLALFYTIQTAFNLDGGSSCTFAFNNQKINAPTNPKKRSVPDCIYFASAWKAEE